MKVKHLFLIPISAALPVLAAIAQDTGKTETTNQQTASAGENKNPAGKECDCNRASTDLDQLVAEMNNAAADKKLDAIAAVVNKLATEFKASKQKSETKTAEAKKSEMGMCEMTMSMDRNDKGNTEEGDSHHH